MKLYRWLRRQFGECRDRWSHDWVYSGRRWLGWDNGPFPKPGDWHRAACRHCGLRMKAFYYSSVAGDGKPGEGWMEDGE